MFQSHFVTLIPKMIFKISLALVCKLVALFESEIVFVKTEQIGWTLLIERLFCDLFINSLNILVALNFIFTIIWIFLIDQL